MASKQPDIKEVSRLRGKLKAKKRAETMAERHAKQQEAAERAYQEKLAHDIMRYI